MITFNVFYSMHRTEMNRRLDNPVDQERRTTVQPMARRPHENRMNLCVTSVVPIVITRRTMVEMFGKSTWSSICLSPSINLLIGFLCSSSSERKHQARKHPNVESKVVKITRQESEHPSSSVTISNYQEQTSIDLNDNDQKEERPRMTKSSSDLPEQPPRSRKEKIKTVKRMDTSMLQNHPPSLTIPPNFAPVRVFQCSSCHQQGTYKWVVERHIRAKHPDQPDAHVIELPAELAVKLQKLTPPLKRFRCSLCPLQSKHTWVIIRVSYPLSVYPMRSTRISLTRFFSSFSISNIFTLYKQHQSWTFNQMEYQKTKN